VSGQLLWDVDTQVDFVLAGGKLAVAGAEAAVPQMERLVAWARAEGIGHVASVDDHELTDPEIVDEPDWQNTFPAHCLRGTPGAAKIPATAQHDPLPLPLTPYPPGLVADLVRDRREIVVLKKSFDVFTNPNAEPLLDALDPSEVLVFGVATDVCDDAVIRGLLARGRRVAFVEDASRGLDEARTAACLAHWREAGVRFTTTDEVTGR
jgi:nicotinamidase/pyrazinamidase